MDNTEGERGQGLIRVLIADDHALFRRGLELVLGGEADIEIVGEASDGIEAVDRALELAPDSPEAHVSLMLTVSEDSEDLFAAVRAGATGYLLKEVSIEDVGEAVRAVHRGHSLISPSMASKLLAEFNALSRRVEEQQGVAPRLTDRELEVLRLVAKGLSNREIAAELVIAENTVKNHVRNILEKLQLRSRMEAAMYAVREKLVDTA